MVSGKKVEVNQVQSVSGNTVIITKFTEWQCSIWQHIKTNN